MVAKPCATGPWRSAWSISGSWLSGMLGCRPVGRLCNAAAPPVRQRVRQETAVCLATPSFRLDPFFVLVGAVPRQTS
jgi:hypothetical protein